MPHLKKQLFCFLFVVLILNVGCIDAYAQRGIVYNEQIKTADYLKIHEGILSTKKQKIIYKKGGKKIATIKLSEPIMVAQAEQEEAWGYFQFPSIAKAEDGTLVVTWSMKQDSHVAYGVKSNRKYTPMMSKDDGKTWEPLKNVGFALGGNNHVRLNNGKILEIYTPQAKDIKAYDHIPQYAWKDNDCSYYQLEKLPKELQNIYFNLWNEERKSKLVSSVVEDPGLLRYAIDNLMPIVWWGNIKQIKDESLIAGVYPCFYQEKEYGPAYEAVSFYRSIDEGKTWKYVSKILFQNNGNTYTRGEKSFDEPTFEILNDSTYLCVMRTGSSSPMYRSFSYNGGHTWTRPEPFTPNGVKPWLMKLGNGIIVLASGRPGVQLRFNIDGKGKEWTDPIDMISFMKQDGTYSSDVSCGYVSMCKASSNTIYFVYSDFTTKDKLGKTRKSIWFRKVTVKR